MREGGRPTAHLWTTAVGRACPPAHTPQGNTVLAPTCSAARLSRLLYSCSRALTDASRTRASCSGARTWGLKQGWVGGASRCRRGTWRRATGGDGRMPHSCTTLLPSPHAVPKPPPHLVGQRPGNVLQGGRCGEGGQGSSERQQDGCVHAQAQTALEGLAREAAPPLCSCRQRQTYLQTCRVCCAGWDPP